MKRKSVNLISKLRLLLLFPFIAFIFWSCTEQDYDLVTVEGNEQPSGQALLLNTIRVNGLVFGDSGPVAKARVGVSGSSAEAVTDEEGYFELDVPEGSLITFSAHGYSPKTWERRFPRKEFKEPWAIGVRLYRDGYPGRIPPPGLSTPPPPPPSFYIVDGKIVSDIKELGSLPGPSDIANISVLRGESAVSLYGKKAKDGVIIITTRK